MMVKDHMKVVISPLAVGEREEPLLSHREREKIVSNLLNTIPRDLDWYPLYILAEPNKPDIVSVVFTRSPINLKKIFKDCTEHTNWKLYTSPGDAYMDFSKFSGLLGKTMYHIVEAIMYDCGRDNGKSPVRVILDFTKCELSGEGGQ